MAAMRIENAGSLLAIATASAIVATIIFMAGYTSEFGSSLFGFFDYRDFILVFAKALLALGGGVVGIAIGSAQEGIQKTRNSFVDSPPQNQKIPQFSPEKSAAILKWIDRFPAITFFIFVLLSALAANLALPRQYTFFFIILFWALGSSSMMIIWIKELCVVTKAQIIIAAVLFFIGIYMYGQYSFYQDVFFKPTWIKTSFKIRDKDQFVLVRSSVNGTLLFDPATSQAIFVLTDPNRFVVFQHRVCLETKLQQALQAARGEQVCPVTTDKSL